MAGAAKSTLQIVGIERFSPAELAAHERRIQASRKRVTPSAPRSLTAAELGIVPVERKVADPYEPGEKIAVALNRNVDILEKLRSEKHFSEAAYLTGREIQAVFEKAMRSGGSNWTGGDRVDISEAKDRQIVSRLEAAAHIEAEMTRLTSEVGRVGARFLREILSGTSFAEYAARTVGAGERKTEQVGARFRWLLEDIAEDRAATGKRGPKPDDKFSADWDRAMAARRGEG